MIKKYKLVFSERAAKEIKKLDNSTKKLLNNWLIKHLEACENPRSLGKALTNDKKGLWRYRVGNYRLICIIEDDKLLIVALTFGHRSEVYDK